VAEISVAGDPFVANSREARARRIVEEHAREIAESDQGALFKVPSSSHCAEGTYYVVSLSRQVCECADFVHRSTGRSSPCKHLIAAEIVSAKSSPCADCGQRFLRRDVWTVTEDHESLTWFPGDMLCRECAGAHGIR
jgi:predicted nucleic acid-binding Zn finger protein